MHRMRNRLVLLASMGLLALGSRASADGFFNVTSVGSGGTTVADGGPNIIHLTDNVINEQGPYAPLFGQNVTTALTWGGVPDAIILTENAAQTQATITFPSTGFTRTFTASGGSSLQSQIHKFIEQNGEQAYAQFLQKMDQFSAVAPLDGNPQASTAVIADGVFTRFGIHNQQPTVSRSDSGATYLGLTADGGASRADSLDGSWADVNFDTGLRFGSHAALSLGTTLAFTNISGSEAYTVAEEIAVPVTIFNNRGNGLSWQVTPWGFAGLSASYDQAAGGLLVGGGGTSSFALHWDGLTVTLGDQVSYTSNVDVSVDDYQFDTDIDQWIIKNGLEASYQFPRSPFFVEGGVTYSNFLHHAAVPDYWTPAVGVGLAFGGHSSLRVDYRGDYAKGYNSTGGEVSLVIAY